MSDEFASISLVVIVVRHPAVMFPGGGGTNQPWGAISKFEISSSARSPRALVCFSTEYAHLQS